MIIGDAATFRRLQTPGRLLAYLVLFVACTAITVNFVRPFQMDFISYWAAAVLALDGNAVGAYDIALHHAVEARAVAFDGLMPFPYPPPFLILLLPLGLLAFPVAAALWIAVTFAGYSAAARRLSPGAGWLIVAFPPVLVNAIIGQNGFLTAGLFIGGLLLLPKRPFLAGLVFGCLIVKPHLALLLPLAFIAGRQWRAFAGASLSASGLLLLGLIAFGPSSYLAWLEQTPLYASIVADGLVGWHKMASVYAALRLVGLPAQVAWTIHILIALAGAAATWRVWRSGCEPAAKAATLAAATALASPYLYLYDALVLIVPFLWLATVERYRPWLGLLWCLLLVAFAQNWGFNKLINPAPLVPVVLLALAWRQLFGPEGRASAAASDAVALPRAAGLG